MVMVNVIELELEGEKKSVVMVMWDEDMDDVMVEDVGEMTATATATGASKTSDFTECVKYILM